MTNNSGILLQQLEALVAVKRRGTISGAAEQLFVSQPALTSRIQGLERSLGTELLTRGRHGSRLTEAGLALLPHAERVLSAIDRGRQAVEEVVRGSGGRLTIGAAPAISTYVLPTMLHRFQAAYPGVQLSVRSGHSEDVLDMVLREEVEVGLMRPIYHPDIVSSLLYEDDLVLVVPPGHPFASTAEIRMEQMASEHLVLFDRTSSYHELTSALFRQAGIAPRGYLEVDNIEAAKRMVEQRLGIALLPMSSVQSEIGTGRLFPAVVVGATPIKRQIVVSRRRDAGDASAAATAFLRTLDDVSPNAERVAAHPAMAKDGSREPSTAFEHGKDGRGGAATRGSREADIPFSRVDPRMED